MNILILDTETTGLEPSKGARLIEIGALLYSVTHQVTLQTFSTFLPTAVNEAEHINHIKPEWTRSGYDIVPAFDMLEGMANMADFIVAHNAAFDKKFMQLAEMSDSFYAKRWICTKENFTWPVRLPRMRLEDICHAMGVSYVGAHRALTDVQFLADCFSKIEDLERRFEKFERMT